MEFLAGKTLRQRLAEPLPPSQDETIDILRDIPAALAALQERGVIHLDLRPCNVMLVPGEPTRLLWFWRGEGDDQPYPDSRQHTVG